ncbi:MAG: alanine--tRNA ligase [Mailhella sp.]|nr:alanine--tRNA ligase [Mailhella sp.]
MLTAKQIREKFLAYYEKHGHKRVASSSLVPRDDPSLLFTNAGMVQFKQIFLGQETRAYTRATTAQKCLRVSGKHNDLENVGRTARHHTFFEMLGNFSFGDYFKEDAIRFAWGFITEELGLPKDKLYVTVYQDDDEAFGLWQSVAGLSPERIFRMGEKDNFWSMGDTGPCGPCSEIYIDQGEDMACGPDCGIGKCDCDRFLEIWNLVFMQFNQPAKGAPREKLPNPSIDTGMGLERITAVCQGKRSNFDGDLFRGIIEFTAENAGVAYSQSLPDTNDTDTALRVIADHSRAAAFMVSDGIMPSNEGRGYVLRRLIRRALRFATLMGVHEPILYKTVGKVIDVMGDDYPELRQNPDFIVRVVLEEEKRFRLTLDKGLLLLDEECAALRESGNTVIPGEIAFKLFDTFGFPLDIVSDVAQKNGFTVDGEGYERLMTDQKARARAAWKGSGESDLASRFKTLIEEGLASEFCGYAEHETQSRITALLGDDVLPCESLGEGKKGFLVTGITPFYAASGGQTGDTGMISTPTGELAVTDTLKPQPGLIVHQVQVLRGEVLPDQEALLRIDAERRMAAARNHSCTHLLQAALRKVLGGHVHQAGSLVGPDRLRFDFSHISALTPEETAAVEAEVNAMIMADLQITTEEMDHDKAVASGAMALFNEKYGDVVRVVSMGDVSRELCGGTHLSRTGQAGCFVILSESGISAGTRRIEAATGCNALRILSEYRAQAMDVASELKVRPEECAGRVAELQKEIRRLRKELDAKSAENGMDVMSAREEINGIPVVTARTAPMGMKALRTLMDDVRSRLGGGIACLICEDGGKVNLILYVAKDLHDRVTAPALIKEVSAAIGGSGGGRPDLAQAGGSNPLGIEKALQTLKESIAAL